MQLSLSTEYAIHGLFYLALQPSDRLTLVSEIARSQNISETYLAKVFQNLARSGLVASSRGAKGGYSLAFPPHEITLRQVIEATEGASAILNCQAKRRKCGLGEDCRIRLTIGEVERRINEVLEKTTLQSLIESVQQRPVKARWLIPQVRESSGEQSYHEKRSKRSILLPSN